MQVRVRLFARQREIAGAREVAVELPQGSTVADAWAALVVLHPALASGRPYVRYARNGQYTGPEAALDDGDEVACIPPVSGGAGEAGARAPRPDRILELAPAPLPLDLGRQLADRLATPADGAVVIFEGRTRETPGMPAPGEEAEARRHAGRRVEALEYEAFETLALRVFGEIVDAAAARFGVERLAIVHAVGEVPLGEVSVVIVACAPHRDAAFDAARFAMDETKARAPIWKAERFADGHVWIGHVARTDPVE
ncbi:MAG TPA: molybdenum cofactor biosynthesis protein MoaE [Candidatus Nanopelagicales bacterium]|nr:molybdenum cofactor biosynthesis protein MoaE [Candidatus Nanopelagicales bacterium]